MARSIRDVEKIWSNVEGVKKILDARLAFELLRLDLSVSLA